ncbi:MAG TPA: hypothetical protein VGJ14_10115 [Sporichthyaceae bacterium]
MTTVAAAGRTAPPREAEAPPVRPRPTGRYLTDPSPWRASYGIVPGILAAVGVVVMAICWVALSDKVVWRDQISWLVGACLGAGAVVLGGVLWILVGMREVRRGFRDLRRQQRLLSPELAPARIDAPTGEVLILVSAAGMTRAHHPDCLLLRGKNAVPLPVGDDRPRCGVCAAVSERSERTNEHSMTVPHDSAELARQRHE